MVSDQLQDAPLSTLDTDQFTAANDFFLQLVKMQRCVSKSLDRSFRCLPECRGSGLRDEISSQHAAQQNIGTSNAANLNNGRQVASRGRAIGVPFKRPIKSHSSSLSTI
jgi:hypothetical protein